MAWNEQNGQASPARSRAHLTARLPGHMVPQAFLCLDAVPLSPAENGVAGIWEQVLGAEAGERR